MNSSPPESLADKDARLWNPGSIVDFAYLFDVSKGPILPRPRKSKNQPTAEMLRTFKGLVEEAQGIRSTGRPLGKTYGDLGEHFAAIMFGIKLHPPNTKGSDGKLGSELVEVKTITPQKTQDVVRLNAARDFTMVAVVKVTKDFQFGARLISRASLPEPLNNEINLGWDQMIVGAGERALEVHQSFPINRSQPKSEKKLLA